MAAGEFIKKPHQQVEMTLDQVEELRKCALDPIYFVNNYCYIQNQQLGRMKFATRPYQDKIIESLKLNRFNILMIGRQCGKTETTAAYALWYSIFKDDKNVLVASNKQKGATDIMNRIKFMYEGLPNWLRPGVIFYNRGSVEFDNGSKIWSEATTPDTGRGKSVALFICDELAHVKKNIQELMWASILPTLSTGGACVVMSTPNGDNDLFAEIWRQANSDMITGTDGELAEEPFHPIFVPIDEIPGRDEKWQKMMESKLGSLKFRQEYLCEMLSDDALLINSMKLQRMKGRQPLFQDKGFSFWKKPEPSNTYVIGVDVAEGVNQDFSTIQVFELESLEQVAEFRDNRIKEDKLFDAVKWIITKIFSYVDARTHKAPTVYWSFENNSAGAVIGALYHNDEHFPFDAQLITIGEKSGMRTTNKAKIEACRNFKNMVEKNDGGYIIRSEKLIFEMKNYIQRGASYAAKTGCTDDLVSACLILTRVLKYLASYEPDVFDKIYKSEGEFYDQETSEFVEPLPFITSNSGGGGLDEDGFTFS